MPGKSKVTVFTDKDLEELRRSLGVAEVAGQELKALRVSLGLTQHELGVKLGVEGPVIGLWERGKRKPRMPHLGKLLVFMAEHQKKGKRTL